MTDKTKYFKRIQGVDPLHEDGISIMHKPVLATAGIPVAEAARFQDEYNKLLCAYRERGKRCAHLTGLLCDAGVCPDCKREYEYQPDGSTVSCKCAGVVWPVGIELPLILQLRNEIKSLKQNVSPHSKELISLPKMSDLHRALEALRLKQEAATNPDCNQNDGTN